jgi:hypothetical protein
MHEVDTLAFSNGRCRLEFLIRFSACNRRLQAQLRTAIAAPTRIVCKNPPLRSSVLGRASNVAVLPSASWPELSQPAGRRTHAAIASASPASTRWLAPRRGPSIPEHVAHRPADNSSLSWAYLGPCNFPEPSMCSSEKTPNLESDNFNGVDHLRKASKGPMIFSMSSTSSPAI